MWKADTKRTYQGIGGTVRRHETNTVNVDISKKTKPSVSSSVRLEVSLEDTE